MINTITHAEFPHGDLGGGVLTEAHPRLTGTAGQTRRMWSGLLMNLGDDRGNARGGR